MFVHNKEVDYWIVGFTITIMLVKVD